MSRWDLDQLLEEDHEKTLSKEPERSSSLILTRILTSKWAVRAYALIIFFAAWQIIGEFTSPLFFATPGVVAGRMAQLLVDGSSNGIPVNALITIETVLAGFIPAVAVGVPVGILIGRNRFAEYSLDPYINLIYAVPLIVMIPILIVWLGSNIVSNYVLTFIGALFPIAINSISGAKNVRATLLETGRSFGFAGPGMWRRIIFPASLPYVMAGLRIGIGHAVIGAILAELLMYSSGLGLLIEDSVALFDAAGVISAVIVTVLLGILMTESIKVFERRVSMWSSEFGTE